MPPCERKGHFKNKCSYYLNGLQSKKSKSENHKTFQAVHINDLNNQSNFAFMTGENTLDIINGDKISYILDSRASDHVIKRSDLILVFEDFQLPIKISVAKTGELITATKKGSQRFISNLEI